MSADPSFVAQAFSSLACGAVVGLGALSLLLLNGRIAGVSGILGETLPPGGRSEGFRLPFLLGLVVTGFAAVWLDPTHVGAPPRSLALLALAGLLVGVGTRLSGGCTSGHGVCGLGRLSLRSLVATLAFVATGMLTATLAGGAGGTP